MGGRATREATPGDLAAVRAIAAEHHLLDPAWPVGPDFLDLELASGRLVVAEAGGVVEGFAGTLTRGTLTHLGDLFITGRAQSGGHGRRLLAAVLPPAGEAVVTFASDDRRALSLYLRHGLVPGQPLWYLRGAPTAVVPDPDPDSWPRPRPATVDEVVDLDAAVSGGDRRDHLAWYAGLPGVSVWATPGGYAFTRQDAISCRVGPAGGCDPDASVRAVRAAVGYAAARGLVVRIAVFGAHPAVRGLLEAGLRIVDADTLMTSRPGLLVTDSYVPNADLG